MTSSEVKIVLEADFKSKFMSRMQSIINNNKDTLYTPTYKSNKSYLNFINTYFGDYYDNTIKSLIEALVLELETAAPGSSDLFIEMIINYYHHNIDCYEYFNKIFKKEILRINRHDLLGLAKDNTDANSKMIMDKLINILEYDDQIFVEDSIRTTSVIKKTNQLFFNLKYDNSFLTPFKGIWNRQNYRFIIVDGFIDSLSEIHHLLHNASENKEPYVLFCKGMREEVKHTIMYNLQRKTIDVMPICLEINEENVNVLNDLASCLNSDIITSSKGDIISTEVRRELPIGKQIKISNSGFYLECESKYKADKQLKYLKNKIKNLDKHDPNTKFIESRIKSLESKKIEIILSSSTDSQTKEDLNSFLKLITNVNLGIVYLKKKNKNRSFYTVSELNIIIKKAKSLIKTIDNLGCIIYKE